MLDLGFSPHARNGFGEQPLHTAAYVGNADGGPSADRRRSRHRRPRRPIRLHAAGLRHRGQRRAGRPARRLDRGGPPAHRRRRLPSRTCGSRASRPARRSPTFCRATASPPTSEPGPQPDDQAEVPGVTRHRRHGRYRPASRSRLPRPRPRPARVAPAPRRSTGPESAATARRSSTGTGPPGRRHRGDRRKRGGRRRRRRARTRPWPARPKEPGRPRQSSSTRSSPSTTPRSSTSASTPTGAAHSPASREAERPVTVHRRVNHWIESLPAL